MSHFEQQASTWDDEKKVQLMKVLSREVIRILEAQQILQSDMDIVDVGCGTGLFGLSFSNYAAHLVGVDTSDAMLAEFERKSAAQAGIRSMNINLEEADVDLQADLFVSSMAFHHLVEPAAMVVKLKSMLNTGGAIVIVDLDNEDGSFHPDNASMGVRHFGFSKEAVEQWARDSNMALHYQIVHTQEKNGRRYPMFLAVLQ